MRKIILVILAVLFTYSMLFCTTPLTKGSIVNQKTTRIASPKMQQHAGTRNINSFPWTENFADAPGGPYLWNWYDADGTGTEWQFEPYFSQSVDGSGCAIHHSSTENTPEQGWLVSPALDLPAGNALSLSFWSYNYYPQNYGANSVLVSNGSISPEDGDYVDLWSPVTVTAGWYQNYVDLTPWAGQTIFIAFRYEGLNAHEWCLDDVRVEEHTGIHEFPYVENFESGVFPPYYWGSFDEDGVGTQWDWGQGINHSADGRCSARHLQDPVEPVQDGWLVTPHIQVPLEGTFSLSFWSANGSSEVYGRNSVHISAGSNVPADGDFMEIWSPITVSESWMLNYVDLTPWAGQNIVIAFRYQSNNSHSWYLDDVTFDYFTGISDFPYTENFESGVFPPYYWTAFDADGSGTAWSWVDYINFSEGGTCSAVHTWDADEPAEEGWLVTPLIRLPSDGSVDMSFWSYNNWAQYYGSNGLCISTGSSDPADGDYVQIWSPTSVNEISKTTIELSPWAGMDIYIAFVYQGLVAHDWYLDDVVFTPYLQDDQPPVISHLPLINTPRDDAPYSVVADVTDDPIYNSGISAVYLYYRVNYGDFNEVPMVELRSGYSADIPQQALGSTVEYYIRAFDNSAAGNQIDTPWYSFLVDDPVWLHYHDGIQTMWAGMTDDSWGAGVLFANPYYGESIPLKVQAIYGALYYDDTVNLQVYAADDEYLGNLTPLMEPFAAFYPGATGTETAIPELSITSAYFYVTIEDINAGNFFTAEDIFYPNRCFLIWDGQNIEFGSMSFYNVWMLEVLVESGASPYPAPMLSYRLEDGQPVLQWTEVLGSYQYNVYATMTPYDPESWQLYDSTSLLELGDIAAESYNFFRVTAAFNPEKRAERAARHSVQQRPGKRNLEGVPFKTLNP